MKLNNHGWGMRTMIIYVCILLIFLLISNSMISTMYEDLEAELNTTKNDDSQVKDEEEVIISDEPKIDYVFYSNYEKRMEEATRTYLNNVDIYLNTCIYMVTLEDLVAYGYIETLYDQVDGSTCIGYSNITDNEFGEYEIDSYVRCNNYVTEGY